LTQAFPELRPNNYLRSTPIVIDGVLYAQNVHGLVVAFDGETGKTVWEQELFARTREEAAGSSTRGVDYWRGGGGNADQRIFAIRGEYLYALNAQTGKPIPGFGAEGRTSLHFQENQPLAARFNDSTGPLVVGNVVVVTGNTAGAGDTGTFKKEAAPEDVRGFDARSGKLLWTFHVVPRPGEYGVETWGNESWKIAGDLGAWNPMTADEDLGYVYIPLTAPTASAWGVWRPGDNLFADSLVALDAKTGKRVWHFQTVHHNLWEWENVGPAMLGDITVDGRRIKAVMQPNKNGFLFVLDRTNGKPVWPIEERPVPQSNVPGERTSPTQPFPTRPPAFDRQGVADTDLIDYTPALKARAREIAKEFVTGPLFTPPSITTDEPGTNRGTLMLPGSWGAANWNTGAFDPETGFYYAVSASLPGPSNRAIKKMTNPEATMEYASVGTAPDIEGLPIIKGPYGRITAMDLKTGTQVWMVANGDGPRYHPLLKDLNLPALGVPNRPAPLLTKMLLFLGEGSNAVSGTPQTDWGWGRTFRAYDKATGAVIWETLLPSGTTGGPMTYMLKGKQYIVVPVGSRNEPAEYVALALP
jgi:quinoprotein glucose dehydrogenase